MKIKLGFESDASLLNSLLLIKIFYIFFAEFLYSKLTRLGDTPKYLNSLPDFSLNVFFSSTSLMKFTGGMFGVFPTVIAYLPLCLLSWYGIRFLYKTLVNVGCVYSYFDRCLFFLFFSLPTIGVWSSIHSKEAVGVFFTSVLSAFLCQLLYKDKFKFSRSELFLILLSSYLMLIFKPQYYIGFASAFIFLYFRRFFVKSPFFLFCFVLTVILVQLYILYYFQPIVDFYAMQMYGHFDSALAQSTRDNIFLAEGDFYKNAYPGLFVAFFGPTLSEALSSFSKGSAFIESFILSSVFILAIFYGFRKILLFKVNVLYFSLVILLLGWLLFMHYPFGIFNPGSAIRYRTNFIPFLCFVFFVLKNYDKRKN